MPIADRPLCCHGKHPRSWTSVCFSKPTPFVFTNLIPRFLRLLEIFCISIDVMIHILPIIDFILNKRKLKFELPMKVCRWCGAFFEHYFLHVLGILVITVLLRQVITFITSSYFHHIQLLSSHPSCIKFACRQSFSLWRKKRILRTEKCLFVLLELNTPFWGHCGRCVMNALPVSIMS